jgi:hypothetical protein
MRKGRFNKPVAKIAQRFSESVSFDWRLYRYDIAGSIAHAAALARSGLISRDEQQQIETGLRAIEKEIESGKFDWDRWLEDVHMNIEAALTKRIGSAGGKLHTARSRNDQIALDLRRLCERGEPRGDRARPQVAKYVASPLNNTPMLRCRVTPTCGMPNRLTSPITCWEGSKVSNATRGAFVIAWFEQIFFHLGLAHSLDRQSFSIANSSLANLVFRV